MEIVGVSLKGFKRSPEVDISVPGTSVVIGGNNSGKSSLLQGIHFALTVLQSAGLAGEDGKSMSTLGFDQVLYKPTNNLIGLYTDGPITSKSGPEFSFSYLAPGSQEIQEFKLALRRGKNANLSIAFEKKSPFFVRAADTAHPMSIFVPALAGVSLREERRTQSVVTNGIAQVDSNLYLRNVLLDIIEDNIKLERFHNVIRGIFPGLEIRCNFNPKVNLYIDLLVQVGERLVPLEMVGTGALQAIQLVAYVTAYDPALLLLDEPDAHLHPSNQRALAATLGAIVETSSTKVIVATHSRHMFDALASRDDCQVVWLKDGVKQASPDQASTSILLDLGALDSYEMLAAGGKKAVYLTEDTKPNLSKILLAANGLQQDDYFIQPLNGVDNLSAIRPVADFFLSLANDTNVIVHRDGDCMLENERAWWIQREATKLPAKTHLFVTPFTDIEHSFCQPEHVAEIYGVDLAVAGQIVADAIAAGGAPLVAEFTSKRTQLKNGILRKMDPEPPGAADLLAQSIASNNRRAE